MFGRKIEKDPQKALDNAKKTMNSGLTGGLTRAFMGKDFVDDMNNAMNKGQAALDMQKSGQWIAQAGMDATAEVLSIQDTGSLINMNPAVYLEVKGSTRNGCRLRNDSTNDGFQDCHPAVSVTPSRSNTILPTPHKLL